MDKKNILVTGGAGFIGSHLVDRLIKEGHQVVVIDNLSTGRKENLNKKAKFYKIDICSPKITEIFKKEKPEVVFHYAAQIDVRKSVEDPVGDAKINILGTLNLIQNFISGNQPSYRSKSTISKKFIFASSGGAIYGETKVIPTPETHLAKPESPYGMAKLIAEQYLAFYKKTQGLDYISLRYANVYGSRQNSKSEAGVVAIFINKFLEGDCPSIFGDGKQTRDYLYVDDAVEAGLKALDYQNQSLADSWPVFNVGTGIETSVNKIYDLISKIGEKKIKPTFASAKAGDLKRSCLNYSKIKKELKWNPSFDLEKGLAETIKWFSECRRWW